MAMQFLRGNAQSPRGHAIFVARSSSNPNVVFCTYCIVPPIPMSLAKYIPPLLAAQLPIEDLADANAISGMPIPPMLEEAASMQYLETLAERRDDDFCDIGLVNAHDDAARVERAAIACQEYAQIYADAIARIGNQPTRATSQEPALPEALDTEELFIQTMPDRQKLAELGKLIGTMRYAVGGHDENLLKETRQRMQRLVHHLPSKYRGSELITAAADPKERGTKLAELYLSRAYKLVDEEYADIPGIERAIRDLQE